MSLLGRDDIVAGLSELVAELRREGSPAGLRIVGGAALALRYFERGTTRDVDMLHAQPGSDEAVLAAAGRVAVRRGWDHDWVNFAVTNADAVPTFGRAVRWDTIHEAEGIVIEVAGADAMLAMKLRANRPGRDTDDIRQLLALCGVGDVAAAAELYEAFYPGDALPDRAVRMVEAIIVEAPLAAPAPVPRPRIAE